MREALEHALALIEGANGLAIREDASWPMYREAFQAALATPSAPVSAPSPAGGVREALVCDEVIDHTSAEIAKLVGREDEAQAVAAAVKRALVFMRSVFTARLSSPATPEPVSAPANGEVAVEQAATRIIRNRAADGPSADRAVAHARQFDTDVWRDAKRDARAALSNPAPGHGEGVPVADVTREALRSADILTERAHDPMWDAHAEVSKRTLLKAAQLLVALAHPAGEKEGRS